MICNLRLGYCVTISPYIIMTVLVKNSKCYHCQSIFICVFKLKIDISYIVYVCINIALLLGLSFMVKSSKTIPQLKLQRNLLQSGTGCSTILTTCLIILTTS